ncbi:MAG: FG-GAP repeat protein [Myxococcales bacterium]|nr:FG-GAP repeat protein [Myxococcales bacterium]
MKLSMKSAAALGCLLSACFVDRSRYVAAGDGSIATDANDTGAADVAMDTGVVVDTGVDASVDDVQDSSAPFVTPRLIAPLSTTNVTTAVVLVAVDMGETGGTFTVEFNRSPTFEIAQVGSVLMGRGTGRQLAVGDVGRPMSDRRGIWFFRACDMRAPRGTSCSAVWSINVLSNSLTGSQSGHGVAANFQGDLGQDVLVTSRVIQPPSTLSHLSRTFFYSTFGAGSPTASGNLDECTQVHMPTPNCATFGGGFLLGPLSSILGDATGDGRADAALYGAQGSAVSVGTIALVGGDPTMPSYLGRITANSTVPFAGGASPAGDFNGDGLADLATIVNAPNGGSTRRRLDVFLAQRGPIPFSIDRRVALTLPALDSGDIPIPARVTAAGDMNNDGYADLAVRGRNTINGAGEVWIYAGGPDPVTTPPRLARIGGGSRNNFANAIAGGGDADGDGIADLFVTWGNDGGYISLSVLHGGTSSSPITDEISNGLPWITGEEPGVIAAGDVTGDGLIDALLVDNLSLASRIEVTSFRPMVGFALFLPSIMASGSERFLPRMLLRDVTGDGRAEIIVPVRPMGTGDAGNIRLYSKMPMGTAPGIIEITSPDATGVQFGIDAL